MSRKILVGLVVAGLVVFGWSQVSSAVKYGSGVIVKNQAGGFVSSDFNGTWNMYTAWQDKDAVNNGWVYGPITSDGAGAITAGTTLSFQDGGTDTVAAGSTYTVNADGTMTSTLNLTGGEIINIIGAMNDSKDVVGMVYTVQDSGTDIVYGSGVIVKNQAGGFVSGDFNGTWNMYTAWQDKDAVNNGWVYGPITSDGAGAITAGTTLTVQDGGTDTVAADSTYTGNADGTIISTLNFTSGATVDIIGAMNDSKDVVGMVYTVQDSGTDIAYGSGVIVKNQAGGFVSGDFNGTWGLYGSWQKKDAAGNGWVYGPITSDGAGAITAGTTLSFQDGGTDTVAAGSTYTVNADGTMTISMPSEGVTLTGAITDPKDVVGFVHTNTETPAAPVTGGGGGGGGCFIATASFGTPMAEEVKSLCKFRDEVLMKTTAGRDFVELYYKISPPIADFIRNKPALKAMVRIGLKPLVWFSRLVK